jgi:FixJ family two-component response regulator
VIALDIAAMVEEMGHLVVGTASRKDEAVAMARATRPGLVLADVRLGDADGGILAIRELGRSLLAPVVFVTGHPDLVMGDRSLDDAFLVTKPIDRDLLRTVIATALTRH